VSQRLLSAIAGETVIQYGARQKVAPFPFFIAATFRGGRVLNNQDRRAPGSGKSQASGKAQAGAVKQ
jgi:hypothetical protein